MDSRIKSEIEHFRRIREELQEVCAEAEEEMIRSQEIIIRAAKTSQKVRATKDRIDTRRANREQNDS